MKNKLLFLVAFIWISAAIACGTIFLAIPYVNLNKTNEILNSSSFKEAYEFIQNSSIRPLGMTDQDVMNIKAGVYLEDGDYEDAIDIIYNAGGVVNVNYDDGSGNKSNDTIRKLSYIDEQPINFGYDFKEWVLDSFSYDLKELEATLNLVASYEIVEYTISYNLDGGTIDGTNPTTYNVEDEITIINPAKTGYTFTGWTINNSADKYNNVIIDGNYATNLVLKANFNINDYIITLDLNGGTADVDSLNVTYNESYAIYPPIRVGYRFVGWFLNGVKFEFGSLYDSGYFTGTYSIASDITLKAEWETASYSISYDLNGGVIDGNNPEAYNVEGEYEIINPTKTGYTFIGWSIKDYWNNPISDSNPIINLKINGQYAQHLKLKANYKVNDYLITLNSNGGNAEVESLTVTYLNTFSLPTANRTGYTFAGWLLDGNKFYSGKYNIASNITLKAEWNVITYSISYNLDGGTIDGTNPTTYNVEDEITIINPTKTGYTFKGWNINDNSSLFSNIELKGQYAKNITLTANFEVNKYIITLNVDGGDLGANSLDVIYGDSYSLPSPTRVGYTFSGWYLDEDNFNSGVYNITSDITIKAKWNAIAYSISYVLNGGTVEGSNPTTYTVEDKITIINPTKTGHTFTGWIINDCNDKTDTISIKGQYMQNLKLIANFVANDYTITFDADGGTLNTDSLIVTFNSSCTLPTPTKTGYAFIGWYLDEEEITSGIYNIASNISLKAVWNDFSFKYLSNNTIEITKYYGSNTNYIIPSFYNGVQITSIGNEAFYRYSSLTSITIPDNVTSIGSEAFRNCSSLTSITIPDHVTLIGESAFFGCSSLKNITIPDSVTSIGSEAFRNCSSLTSTIIGNSVTSMGGRTYYDCSSLTSVVIRDGVTSIAYGAFIYCSSLTSITIPNSVTSIGSKAFYGCSSLSTIVIPNDVTLIEESTFEYCFSLKSITIPNGLTKICSDAFYCCFSLTSITIPNSVKNIEDHAFYGCYRLIEIVNKSTLNIVVGSFDYGYIGRYAKQILNDKSQSYLKEVNDYIIYDNTTLVCYIGSDLVVSVPNGIKSINSYAFYDCSSLTSITIPDSVTSIGYSAFYGCSSLTSITIPNTVTTIGEEAFYGCSSLTSITIPNTVTKIVDGAFRGCSSLTSITIPNTVTDIGEEAFRGCSSLTSITIPNSVKGINSKAFYNCLLLSEIKYQGTIDQWKSISIIHNWMSDSNQYGYDINTRQYIINCTDGNISK